MNKRTRRGRSGRSSHCPLAAGWTWNGQEALGDWPQQEKRWMIIRRGVNMPGQVIGLISVIMLLFEIAVVGAYFGGMSLLMLLGPVFKRTDFLIGWLIHVAAAILCFVSMVGVGFCFAGTISRKSFFKRLLFTLSVLGVLPLLLAIYFGIDDSWIMFMAYFLAVWGVLLMITILIAFRHMELRTPKPQGWEE
jgi:hypothetical protein